MIRMLVLSALLFIPGRSLAQELDAGYVDAGTPQTLVEMAKADQTAFDLDAGVKSPLPSSEAAIVREVFLAVKSGNWWLAASAFLILVVGLLRKYGKKVHEFLDDNNPLDKWFFHPIFDTKIGGWVLNWLTAIAGGLGTAWAAGSKIDGSLMQSVLLVSTSATVLIELWDDVKEWWDARKAKKAADAVAAAAALPKPPAPTTPGA